MDWKGKVELFEKIRREYEEGVGTILGVARKLGVHRRMVRDAIRNAVPAQRRKMEREPTRLLCEVLLYVHQILEQDQLAPRKQRHTAQRIFERLREEKPEHSVSARSVRRAVQEWREQRKIERAETFISQQYQAGGEAQVDWYEAQAEIAGEAVTLQVFCMRSMYTGAAFHHAYRRATQLAFLDGHSRGFEMFGGVFEVLRLDNLKSAVKQILRGKRREESARFIAFRSHYRFEAEFCTPARGNEKGGVEQEIGRFRRRWWTPVPSFSSLGELNKYLLGCCIRDRERRIEGRPQTVSEAFEHERGRLKQRPAEEFELSESVSCVVDGNGCVRAKHNRYSTPLRPGARAEVHIDAAHVAVLSDGQEVARHERCYAAQQEVLVLDHYLSVLERKPGALEHSKALAQYRQAGLWPESFDRLWERLMARCGKSAGTRDMISLLRQVPVYGTERVRIAIESALACGSSDAAAVMHLLRPETRAEHRATPLAGSGFGYERPMPALDIYDQLLSSGPAEVRQ